MPSRRELANAIRALAMDAVQKANSGHPGMPMGMADIAEVLWNDYLQHNPSNPRWVDRDRFILSNGHGSMLQYALLHLAGYELPMDQLKAFRQLGSETPGHPEYGDTPGIETTTGPLGQGLANGVGMALAEKLLAAHFNRGEHKVVDHYTYVFAGDGCLMEGVSHEACSLAGHLRLGKLITFYDDNGISIDGEVAGWFSDDTPRRFEAYDWHVVRDVDGHDPEAVKRAIEEARSITDKPSLICCKTVIGWGSPNMAGSEATHGAALGDDEVAAVRQQIGWQHEPFVIPDEIYQGWDARERGARLEAEWNERLAAYRKDHPELAAELERRTRGELPEGFAKKAAALVAEAQESGKTDATRKHSQKALEGFGPMLPELIGGSADLTGSNNTKWSGCKAVTNDDATGNYVFYGVREFAMTAMMNGMTLHEGVRPYGGTFLIFSDYARNAIRVSALMKINPILVYTHDSIGLGEDGPTHQPIEQLPSLRYIPNMTVWRPCDAVETTVAWQAALEHRGGPISLVLSRQKTKHEARDKEQVENIRRGGYVLKDCDGEPEAIIIATGGEVMHATDAAEQLAKKGRKVRVVSMPSAEVFERQDASYRESVLPSSVQARVVVEAAYPDYWYKYVDPNRGRIIGMNEFGRSAPAGDIFELFGFTADNVARTVEEVVGG